VETQICGPSLADSESELGQICCPSNLNSATSLGRPAPARRRSHRSEKPGSLTGKRRHKRPDGRAQDRGSGRGHGAALLGSRGPRPFGSRFPLLAKLLDCADWLSVQVHPNDEQARRMSVPGSSARLRRGSSYRRRPMPGSCSESGRERPLREVASAIRGGRAVDVAATITGPTGEAALIPAGMLQRAGSPACSCTNPAGQRTRPTAPTIGTARSRRDASCTSRNPSR